MRSFITATLVVVVILAPVSPILFDLIKEKTASKTVSLLMAGAAILALSALTVLAAFVG